MLDLALAIAHHILIFAIFGILFAEFVVVRPGLSNAAARRIAAMDAWYGALAGAVIVIGFCRAICAARAGLTIHTPDSSGPKSRTSP